MPEAANGAAQNGSGHPAPHSLPPLYRSMEALNPAVHGDLRLRESNFAFTADASALPVTAEEFSAAARTLPIVFAANPPHMPVVLLGLAVGHNGQVDAEGRWRVGVYIPAYARRYPFYLLRTAPGSDELALCVDTKAPHFAEDEGQPLFGPDGQATTALTRAADFSRAVEEAVLRTHRMMLGLAELRLLRPTNVQFRQDGRSLNVEGFYAIDKPALEALPADQLALLRDRGWLEAIYAHLLSIAGVAELARALTDD